MPVTKPTIVKRIAAKTAFIISQVDDQIVLMRSRTLWIYPQIVVNTDIIVVEIAFQTVLTTVEMAVQMLSHVV